MQVNEINGVYSRFCNTMQELRINGVLGHGSELYGYTGPGTTWANGMYFVMNHVPGAGSPAQPVDQQSSALPLYHGCPLHYAGISPYIA